MSIDVNFRWDYTVDAMQAARLNRPEPPRPLYEEKPIKVPKIWHDHTVIGRDTRVSGGVYLCATTDGQSVAEACVVDDKKSPELNVLYQEVRQRMHHMSKETGKPEKNLAFLAIREVVNEIMPRYKGVIEDTERLVDSFQGKDIGIEEFIKSNLGVCRHKALLGAYMIERLIDEGVLRGKVSVDRNFDPVKNVGHAWVRYTSQNGEVFVFDPARNFTGTLKEAMKAKVWEYRRPTDIASPDKRIRLTWGMATIPAK